jgi:hypothetical protein
MPNGSRCVHLGIDETGLLQFADEVLFGEGASDAPA